MTDSSLAEGARYRLPADDPQGFILGLSQSQFVWGAAFVVVGVLCGVAGSLVLALLSIGIGVAGALGSWQGQSVLLWLLLFGRLAVRRLTGQSEWFAPFNAAVVSENGDVEPVPMPLPPMLAGLTIEVAPADIGGEVGFVVNRSRGEVTVMFRASGTMFALIEPAEKDRLLVLWGQALSTFAGRRGVTQVSWTSVAVTAGVAEHRAWMATVGGDRAADAVESYAELLGDPSVSQLRRHEVVVQMTVARRLLRPTRRPNGRTPQEQLASEAVAAGQEMRRQLSQAGLVVADLMTAPQIAGWLRARVDPVSAAERSIAAVRAGLAPDVCLVESAGPTSVVEHASSVVVDGRHHAMFEVSEFPRLATDAGWLEPLLRFSEGNRVLTVLMEPVAPSRSERQLERSISGMESEAELRRDRGVRTTAKHQRALAEARRLEGELAAGFREMRFRAVMGVSARTADELDEAVDELRTAAVNAHVEVRSLWGRQGAAWAVGAGLGVIPGVPR